MTGKLLLVIGVTTLAMLSPGPDMVLVMRNTLTRDRRSGNLTALGVLTGNMFHIGYCTLGIAVLLSRNPIAYNALRIASAVYLISLGLRSLRRVQSGNKDADAPPGNRFSQPYWQGLVNNVLNPKGSLFYLGVFSQLITPDMTFAQSALLVIAMVAVSAVFWIVFVQTLHLPMIRAAVDRSRGWIDSAFACVLILLGASVAMSGWRSR